jgi:hypothetical protein
MIYLIVCDIFRVSKALLFSLVCFSFTLALIRSWIGYGKLTKLKSFAHLSRWVLDRPQFADKQFLYLKQISKVASRKGPVYSIL